MRLDEHAYPGRLVTFCGVDGSGKTTLLRLAGEYLRDRNLPIEEIRMPTDLTRRHPLMLRFMYDPDPAQRASVDFLAVSLIAMADRLQQIKDVVIPALTRGVVVLCDRYVYQSLVFARAMGEREAELVAIAERFPRPDLAVFPDVAASVALARMRQRDKDRDRFVDVELLSRQVSAYRQIAESAGGLRLTSMGQAAETFSVLRPHLDAVADLAGGRRADGGHQDGEIRSAVFTAGRAPSS